jgi:hypothetical protein
MKSQQSVGVVAGHAEAGQGPGSATPATGKRANLWSLTLVSIVD